MSVEFDIFGFGYKKDRKIKHSVNYNLYYVKDYDKKYLHNDFLHIHSNNKFIKPCHNSFYMNKSFKNLKKNKKYFKVDGSCFNNSILMNRYIKRCHRFYKIY